jgi:hypothetical protein
MCDEAISRATRTLVEAGLRVITSFDSRRIRTATHQMPCPYHDSTECNCQVVILLVYGSAREPATVIARGQDGRMWLSLAISPGVRPAARFENKIRQVLASVGSANLNQSV